MEWTPRIGKCLSISEFKVKRCGMELRVLTSGRILGNSTFACIVQ